MDYKTLFLGRRGKMAIAGLLALALLLAAFQAGQAVGWRKARFSYRWGESYHRNFGGPRAGLLGGAPWRGEDLINAHGTAGTVISVDGDTLTIKGRDEVEKTVVISAATVVKAGRQAVSAATLKPEDRLVVLGRPDSQGRIAAILIRLFR